MKTKDGVDYTEGMTLYRVFLRTDHYEIKKVEKTRQHTPEWFVADGGWGGHIGDSFACYDAAIQQVITHLKDELIDKTNHIAAQIKEWRSILNSEAA